MRWKVCTAWKLNLADEFSTVKGNDDNILHRCYNSINIKYEWMLENFQLWRRENFLKLTYNYHQVGLRLFWKCKSFISFYIWSISSIMWEPAFTLPEGLFVGKDVGILIHCVYVLLGNGISRLDVSGISWNNKVSVTIRGFLFQ